MGCVGSRSGQQQIGNELNTEVRVDSEEETFVNSTTSNMEPSGQEENHTTPISPPHLEATDRESSYDDVTDTEEDIPMPIVEDNCDWQNATVNNNNQVSDVENNILVVQVLGSDTFETEWTEGMSIVNLKQQIETTHEIAPKNQRLLHCGKSVPDDFIIPPPPCSLQLIPFPNMKPSADVVIADVDEEINLLMDETITEVFDNFDNVPNTIQRFLIDMLRRTMNDFERDLLSLQDNRHGGPYIHPETSSTLPSDPFITPETDFSPPHSMDMNLDDLTLNDNENNMNINQNFSSNFNDSNMNEEPVGMFPLSSFTSTGNNDTEFEYLERFPENWQINIEDMNKAVMGCEELTLDQLDALFALTYDMLENGGDLNELSRLFTMYGSILSSLGRLCCRVLPNRETGQLELRRGVNVEQVMVLQMIDMS